MDFVDLNDSEDEDMLPNSDKEDSVEKLWVVVVEL